MAYADAVQVIVDRLVDQVGALDATNVFGPSAPRAYNDPDMPDLAVFVEPYADGVNEPLINAAVCGDWREKLVQVTVRGERNDNAGGFNLAVECLTALHRFIPPDWTDLLVIQSQPVYLRENDRQCPEYVLNVRARRVEK